MSTASKVTIQALEYVVKTLPVGTNLALLYVLWALLSGAFLSSRGALFPALLALGLSAGQIRRSSQAVRAGAWSSDELVIRWRAWVVAHSSWQPHSYAGYQPLAVDITAFWRPRLQGWLGKFFNHVANRAITGIGFALVVQVGHTGAQRLPLLKQMICAQQATCSEQQFKARCSNRLASAWGPSKCSCMMPALRLPTCRAPRSHAMSCGWIVTARPGAISCPTRSVARADPPNMAPGAAGGPHVQKAPLARHVTGCDVAVRA